MKRNLGQRACRLESPGWEGSVRAWLEKLLNRHANQGLPVVFDFDNTLVRGDIGEATLAVLAKSGLLAKHKLPRAACPEFRTRDGKLVSLGNCSDAAEYYLAFLDPTVHGALDPAPLGNGYVWAVEVMEGLTPGQIVEATAEAFAIGRKDQNAAIEITPGKTSFPAPSFYPEMVELLARLLVGGFAVWIVSASNVWSVRWMVKNALRPLLRNYGCDLEIPLSQVVGVSTLLRDSQGSLYKDSVLRSENSRYLTLKPTALRKYALTSRLLFPVPTYSGKIACILDYIGKAPLLCAGDSPGDLPMMSFSQNRLWVARLEKPGYQQSAIQTLQPSPASTWKVQPVDGGEFSPCSLRNAAVRGPRFSSKAHESLRLWSKLLR